jgi:hypothetical protein
VLGVLAAALIASASASAAITVTPVCGAVKIHHEWCFSLLVKGSAKPFDGLARTGNGAPDLQSAQKLPSATARGGGTVAVVDASDDPTAESDLAKYRSFDVTSGGNDACKPRLPVHGRARLRRPTGLGTPNGVASF